MSLRTGALVGGRQGFDFPEPLAEPRDLRGPAPRTLAADAHRHRWFGSLLDKKLDGAGLLYKRHRYYDAQTGQFTQEDPIGLAGGLNLYGYAGADPINSSDPFGLCPIEKDGVPCTLTMAGAGLVGGAATGAVYGAAGGTLAVRVSVGAPDVPYGLHAAM